MRWLPRYLCAACIPALSAGVAGSGCADNESTLFVRAVLRIEPPDCVAKPDPSATVMLGGTLDVALRDTYQAALLIGTQLVRRGSRDQLRTETSRVNLRGAEVYIDSAEGDNIYSFTIDGTGFADPGSSEEPGYGVMFVPLIPPSASRRIDPGHVVTVRVKVFGRTLGGTELESNELYFPILVCSGCLVSFPIEADDPVEPGYVCGSNPDFTVTEDPPCWWGQDDAIPCTACVGSDPGLCLEP